MVFLTICSFLKIKSVCHFSERLSEFLLDKHGICWLILGELASFLWWIFLWSSPLKHFGQILFYSPLTCLISSPRIPRFRYLLCSWQLFSAFLFSFSLLLLRALGVFLKFFFHITMGSLAIAIHYITFWRSIQTWWLKRKKLCSFPCFYSHHTMYSLISELQQVHTYSACPVTIA